MGVFSSSAAAGSALLSPTPGASVLLSRHADSSGSIADSASVVIVLGSSPSSCRWVREAGRR